MIYFTSSNDTAEKVARKFFATNIKDEATKIIKENHYTRAVCSMSGDHFLAPNRPIWVNYAYQPDRVETKNIVNILDQLPSVARYKLRKFQKTGISYQHLLAMTYLVNSVNHDAYEQGLLDKKNTPKNNDPDDDLTPGSLLYSGTTAIIDARSERLSKYSKAMKKANKSAINLTDNINSANERKYWLETREAMRELNSEFGDDMRRFNLHNSKYFRKPVTALQRVRKLGREGLTIFDTTEARLALRVARGLKVIATTGLLVEVGCDIYKIADKYQHGGDWQKKLVKDAGELTFGISIPLLFSYFAETALMLTPVGWLGAIGFGLTSLAATIVADHYWKKELNEHG